MLGNGHGDKNIIVERERVEVAPTENSHGTFPPGSGGIWVSPTATPEAAGSRRTIDTAVMRHRAFGRVWNASSSYPPAQS